MVSIVEYLNPTMVITNKFSVIWTTDRKPVVILIILLYPALAK